MATLQEKFDLAVDIIHSLPKEGDFKPTDDQRLKFYGLYKQVTVGKCNTSKPGLLSMDLTGRYKWDAWNALGDLVKEDAMKQYVEEIAKMFTANPANDADAALRGKIDKFLAMVK
eukprot:GHVT01028895.1.p1 GENE.GHVT01028895.1~~GHVT01028895.1.p1  ORF type:complete len:115 (+),score=8.92 GHVT01028895.1:64-408(+)